MVTKSNLGLLLSIVVVSIIIGISNISFIDSANILNLTRQIAMVGIFSIGVAFVIISGGIDLSVGSMIGLTGVLIAKTTIPEPIGYNWPLWLGIVFAISIAMLLWPDPRAFNK